MTEPVTATHPPAAARGVTVWFAATLFVSACLLFLVQPMFAKMALPLLGGTPAVWNTCVVFFQTLLLGGYAYAHGASTWFRPRRHAVMYAVVVSLPLAALPFRLHAD